MKISIGNAPCSWGTLEFGSTKADRITYAQMLDELAACGYTGCELGDWGFMPTDPIQLYATFAQRQLSITGAYIGVPLRDPDQHESGAATVLKIARQLAGLADRLDNGHRPFVVLADDNGTDPVRTANAGRVKPEMGLSDAEWTIFARGANEISAAVQAQTGLQTVFHHHCGGFVETPDDIAQLMARTDPELLGLVFDTGHYSFGAGSCDGIVDAMNRFADRIHYVHFKDCHPQRMREAPEESWDYFQAVGAGVFCELGKGCVDFAAVRDWLQARDYSGFVTVEQDVLPGMGSPRESAQRNRDYLRSIGL